ncbi:MAG: hypothetical protein ABR924_14080 [Terracidiphilus sp.]
MEMIQLEENCEERIFIGVIDWEALSKKVSENPLNYIFLTTQEELTRLYKHVTTIKRSIQEGNNKYLSSIGQINKDDMMPGLAAITTLPVSIPSMRSYTVAISSTMITNTGVVYFSLRGQEKNRVPEINRILENNHKLKQQIDSDLN